MAFEKANRVARARKPAVLDEIVRRIVKVAGPEKIILFGSAARGELGPNSDLDLLVVTANVVERGRLVEAIYMSLVGVGQAVDVIIVTPEEIERYRSSSSLVVEPALRERMLIYERPTLSAR